jgi:hypothetical protein
MADKAIAAAEGRTLQTFNIITQKVDSLVGSILKNPMDASFNAVEPGVAKWTNVLESMYKSDKELMDWETSFSELVTNGLVFEGVEEMFIDKRYHKFGNISFRCHLPGRILFDPAWKTVSAKDCKKAYRIAYMTADEIIEFWPHLKSQANHLLTDVEQIKISGEQWDANDKGVTPNFELQIPSASGRYRVIFCYEMKSEMVDEEYEVTTGRALPVTSDTAYKMAWLDKVNPDWNKSSVKVRPVRKNICWQTVICPEISNWLIIEEKRCEVQIGRLPFFPWSAARINGVPRGIVDLMKDVNEVINNRENLISYIVMTMANGAEVLDPLLFGNDDNMISDYIANKNRVNKVFKSAPGATARDLMPKKIGGVQLDPAITQQLVRMWEYADRLSKSPAVMDAQTTGQAESGYLYAQRTAVAAQQQYILFSGLKRHLNEKSEAYLEQSRVQYALEGQQRDFPVDGGERFVSLNKRVKTEDGTDSYIENDISQLPRQKVIITESPAGQTVRLVNRAIAIDSLKVIPPEELGTRAIFTSMFTDTLDTFDEKQKAKLRRMRALEEEQAEETMRANITKAKLTRLQMEQQVNALQNPAPPPPATQGAIEQAPIPSSTPGGNVPAELMGQEMMAPAQPPVMG